MIWDWIIGSVPSWVWLLMGVVVSILLGALLKQGGWKWAVGAMAAAVAIFMQSRSYQRGAATERAKVEQRNAQAAKDRRSVDDEISNLGSNDVDHRLSKWMRDDDAG